MALHAAIVDEPATAALQVPPCGDSVRSGAALGNLAPARYLVFDNGASVAICNEVTHLGRGITADVHLDDYTVSARHAIIVARPSGLRILDDRSTNGTIVNGRRVDEAELHDGDVVVLGRVVLTYRDLRG
jgi:pSer/pThr/pTyr-binding forkhead associated (FHA) protein